MADRDVLLGVDIGGTKILAGLVDRHGRVVEARRCDTRPDHLLDDTLTACAGLIEAAGRAGRTIEGIGVGAKGVIDRATRCLVGSLYLGHADVPMGAALERAFGLPVRIENDVHAATIGERTFGIGREIDQFLFYNAGTGIAVGIMVEGELFRGASNTAGENGHVVMDQSGRWPCACGLSGCMETMIVSGRRGAALPRIGFAMADDPPEDPAYGYLMASILDLVDMFDPAAIVLTGGMLADNPRGYAWITDTIARSCTRQPRMKPIAVVPAFGGAHAGLIGAAALLIDTPRLGLTPWK